MRRQEPITLLICALGGEGGGVLTEWLVDTARRAGYAAQSTSIPGVAQRTGATTYYLEVFPVPLTQLGGRRPVFSLNPLPGRLDGLLSSELLETSRQIGHGLVSAERTLVISASGRTLTTLERMQPGDGRHDSDELLALLREHSRAHHVLDMSALAREARTVVSAVMLGALAGSGLLPFQRADYEATVRAGGGPAEASLRGFALACDEVQRQRQQQGLLDAWLPAGPHAHGNENSGVGGAAAAAAEPVSPATAPDLHDFPATLHPLLALGHARVCDYQNAAYGERYLQRLRALLAAERAADPSARHSFAATREAARWLALWMAFDDLVRVADLKSRASRLQRVRAEVQARDDELLKVYEHFKPGVPEIAGLLPAPLAARLLAWDRRRAQPWALPLKLGTHTITGLLALRAVARLKAWRVHSSRFATEQALIEQWLQGIHTGLQHSWANGHELAQCGRLIKGYGSTHERGQENLLHILRHLATAAADSIAAARQAALKDEAGQALDATLQAHGAPPRPLKEVPIRWMRRPPTAARP